MQTSRNTPNQCSAKGLWQALARFSPSDAFSMGQENIQSSLTNAGANGILKTKRLCIQDTILFSEMNCYGLSIVVTLQYWKEWPPW